MEKRRRQNQLTERFFTHEPTARQRIFLDDLHDEPEAFYGGAAGGGKSQALLMAALEYVGVAGYSALILRRTYTDLAKPGALLDRARMWLSQTSARQTDNGKKWTFPSGAVLTFGYLENEADKYQYQSAEYQYIAFDEVTQFTESQYTYLFSRLRRLAGVDIPLRMRCASNPAEDPTGFWVAERFVPDDFTPEDAEEPRIFWKIGQDSIGADVRRPFVPARMEDNPHLDQAAYSESLDRLDDVTREQLKKGDWRIKKRGNIYPMWREDYDVISWSEFESVFGVRHIPHHWKCGIAQDWGTTKSHPCATTLFTTAAANSPLPGVVFIPWGLTLYDAQDAQQVARDYLLPELSRLQCKDRIEYWLMSHEASSERNSYNSMGLPFTAWGQDANGGIDQVRRYLKIRNKNRLNPFGKKDRFGEPLFGHPMLMMIVEDDELLHAKTDKGLARHRAEIQSYSYHIPKAGDAPEKLRPQKLFNDAMDTIRCYAEKRFPDIARKTVSERVDEKLDRMGFTNKRLATVDHASEIAVALSRDMYAKQIYDELTSKSGQRYGIGRHLE